MTEERRRTDRASRIVKAPAKALYRALVDPEALVVWLPPQGMCGEISVFEPHAGGRYRMILTYEQREHGPVGKTSDHEDVVEGRFVDLVPDARVVQSTRFDSEDVRFAGEMTLTWDLTPVDGGTKVTITCENVPPGISEEDHAQGLQSSLANLAAYLERG